MTKKLNGKEFDFFMLYDQFITESVRGKRLQPNGKKVSAGTVANYAYSLKLIKKFCGEKKFVLRIRPAQKLSLREKEREKNYWKKFYRQFTDYLYRECGHYDNYVGQTTKNIKVFFNYLNKEKSLGVGEYHKLFYVRKEEIGIFPLLPEELNFLIYNESFNASLSARMQEVKDFFVFGCTVALRVSDLFSLNKQNVRIINGQYFLSVRSIKTNTPTLIKLPSYAVEILCRYSKQRNRLLPFFNKTNLNKYIKKLLELAGFTQQVSKTREKRGEPIELKKDSGSIKVYRFCDVASTHTMRRTAITTMLSLGMPEQVVRKISGHSAHGKEFYRYVLWAQTYQDQETEKMFDKLATKQLAIAAY
ncbi:MAG: tyrosine-type recombinase/integrase [Chitinophagaceae bacterium]|nr:tyrosine-type recombinase/integrase [Chitinophagaceae bacterium]